MKELLGAFGYLGIHQFVSLVFGLVRAKIIATLLGPFGMGIFSQANNLMELVRQISSLGIHDGFLKLVAEFQTSKDQKRLGKTIVTALAVFGLIGILLLLLGSFFSDSVSIWIFDDQNLRWFVLIGIIAGVLSAEYFAFLIVYQALLKWAEYALVSLVGYTLNLIMALVLIYFLELWGAILSMLAAQSMNLLIVTFVLRRSVLPPGFGRLSAYRLDLSALKGLMRYVGPLSTLAMVAALSTILIRSTVVHSLGADTNGIYQVVYAISLAYMGLIRNAFTAFGMPKITALIHDPQKILRVQNDELRLGLLILTPLMLILMVTRLLWIPLLYSADFLSAAPLLMWQFIADLLRMIRITMNISLLPLDRLGFVLIDGLIDWLGWLLLSLLLLPGMGIMAVPFSYMISGLAALLTAFIYHKLTTPFRIYRQNIVLIGKASALLAPGLISAHFGEGFLFQWIIPSILILIMLLWLPGKDEYHQLFAFFKETYSKRIKKKR